MIKRLISGFQAWHSWQIIVFSVVGAVLITDLLTSVVSFLYWGVVRVDLLILGTVNAILVPIIILPVVLRIIRRMTRLEAQNQQHLETISQLQEQQARDFTIQQRVDEMTFLHHLGVSLASGRTLVDTLVALHSELSRLLQVDAFYVAIYDTETDNIRYPIYFDEAGVGDPNDQFFRSLRENPGLAGAVIFNMKTLYLPDMFSQEVIEQYQPLNEKGLQLHTFIGIPLITNGRTLGMLSVQSKKVDAYSPEQIRLMESVAVQAAAAIDKADLLDRLQKELEERRKIEGVLQQSALRLEIAYEIDKALLSTQSLHEIAASTLHGICKLIPCLRASVTMFDIPGSNEVTVLALHVGDQSQPPNQGGLSFDEYGEYILGELRKNQLVFVDNILEEPRATTWDKYLAEQGIVTWLYIPLFAQSELIGAINLSRGLGNPFHHEDAERVIDICNELAIAIQQSRLLEIVQVELNERTKMEASLRERENILEAITFAAEQFLRVSDWRMNINQVMERLGVTIRATHVYLFEHFIGVDEFEYSSLKYEWTAPDYPSDFDNPFYQTPHRLSLDEGSVDDLLRHGNVFIGGVSDFPPSEKERLETLGVKSMMELPIFLDGRWWGTFGFDDYVNDRGWRSSEVDAIKIAVEILSAAIQRQKAEAAVHESERIYRQAIEAAGAVPYFRDYGNNQYTFVGSGIEKMIGYKPDEITADLWLKIMIENIPLAEGTGLYIDNEVLQSRTGSLKVWRSDVLVVAKNGEEKWITDSSVELFDDAEFSYASVGILQDVTNRKLTEMMLRKRESTLQTITFAAEQFLRTSNWREKIDLVLEKLGKELNVSHAYLFEKRTLPDGTETISITYEWADPRYPSDLDNEVFRNMSPEPAGKDRLFDILESGEPLVGNSSFFTAQEWDYLKSIRVKALLEMRIIVDEQHWGTLGFDEVDNEREWTPMEVDVIRVASNVLSAAIKRQSDEAVLQRELDERRKLIEELELRNAESETLRESAAIVAATLEQADAIDRILEQLERVVHFNSASVQLITGDVLEIVSVRGMESDQNVIGLQFPLDNNEPSYPVVCGNAPYLLFDDVQMTQPSFRIAPHNIIHSWLVVPLMVKGQIIGIIGLNGYQVGQFSKRDANLAVTYANQVAIALENARLFSDLQRELDERKKLIEELELRNAESETLRETTAIVAATLERAEAIDRILEQLERVVNYDSASVQLLAGDNLEIVSVRGMENAQEHFGSQFPLDENEPSYPVVRGIIPYGLFDDIQLTHTAFREPPHNVIHAWMVVPLKVKGHIIGVIALDGYQVGQFSERHAKLAVTYANQVAIALENARLFSDLQSELGERKKLINELESKNSELERFTYTVSHDLKSPLVTINGFLGYLEEDAKSGNLERMKRDMQRIQDAVKKMQNLLNELLELSRIGRVMNPPEEASLNILTQDALNLVRGRLEEHRVTVFIQPDLPVVYVDKPRIIEVLQNLLDNAAKYMGDQKAPHIEVGQHGEDGGLPVFYVKDNGMGIAPEFHDQVFGLFNKLDPKSEGTGVGLALVKRIIEIHGGRIWVESGPETGSAFFFTLPVRGG